MIFKKNKLSNDFVDLTIGKVYFKKITNKIITTIEVMSNGNSGLFFKLFEYKLINLSRKKIDNLFIEDATLIRKKLKEILLRYELIKLELPVEEVKNKDGFTNGEIEVFNISKNELIKRHMNKGANNGR